MQVSTRKTILVGSKNEHIMDPGFRIRALRVDLLLAI